VTRHALRHVTDSGLGRYYRIGISKRSYAHYCREHSAKTTTSSEHGRCARTLQALPPPHVTLAWRMHMTRVAAGWTGLRIRLPKSVTPPATLLPPLPHHLPYYTHHTTFLFHPPPHLVGIGSLPAVPTRWATVATCAGRTPATLPPYYARAWADAATCVMARRGWASACACRGRTISTYRCRNWPDGSHTTTHLPVYLELMACAHDVGRAEAMNARRRAAKAGTTSLRSGGRHQAGKELLLNAGIVGGRSVTLPLPQARNLRCRSPPFVRAGAVAPFYRCIGFYHLSLAAATCALIPLQTCRCMPAPLGSFRAYAYVPCYGWEDSFMHASLPCCQHTKHAFPPSRL